MSSTVMCRLCLNTNRRSYFINHTVLQETWERLTDATFDSKDGRPLFVCYICCAQLRNSHQLRKRALKAEELFTKYIPNNGIEDSKKLVSLISKTYNNDYNYAIEEQYNLQFEQKVPETAEEVKKEIQDDEDINIREEGRKVFFYLDKTVAVKEEELEVDEIAIKEEIEDVIEEDNAENAMDDVKTGILPDYEDTLIHVGLEETTQREVGDLERIHLESHKQKQKRLRIAGLEYINSKGKVVPPKQPGPDCLCRRKCFQNVPEDVRLKIFHGFYSMKSRDQRNAYLFGLMRQIDIKRKRVKSSSRRSCTYEYFVRVKGRETQVCQTAFKNIHAINEREVRVLCKKMVDGVMCPSDNRGKNRNKTEQDEIKNHIYSIVHTHRLKDFIRLDKSAGLEINISKMWKDYIKIHDPDNISAKMPKSKRNRESFRQTEAMQPPLTQETFEPISNPNSNLVDTAENYFQNQYKTATRGISSTTNFYRTSNEGLIMGTNPAQPTALVVSQTKPKPSTIDSIPYNHNTELKRSDKKVKQSSKDRKRGPVVKKWKYSNIFQNEINGAVLAAIKTRLAMYYEESDVSRKKVKASRTAKTAPLTYPQSDEVPPHLIT